jgi:sec-independent protein translocase protein TatA
MNTLALLPNLAGGDGVLILLVVFLLFGAKKLPELAKGLGSAVREFSKAKDEVEHELTRPAAPTQPRIEPPRETEVRKGDLHTAVVAEELHDSMISTSG